MKRKEFVKKMSEVLRKRREGLLDVLNRDLGELTSVEPQLVGDSADAAVDTERDSIYSQLASVESRELAAINDALERMKTGDYGVCENCGSDIPVARLQALPYASMCVACQREAELERAAVQQRGEFPTARMVRGEGVTGAPGSLEIEYF